MNYTPFQVATQYTIKPVKQRGHQNRTIVDTLAMNVPLSGEAILSFSFLSFFSMVITSKRKEFASLGDIPLRVNPILEGLWPSGSKKEVTKVVPLFMHGIRQ